MKKGVFILISIFYFTHVFAQMGINVPGTPPIPNASSELEIYSTNKGLLIPKLTQAAITAMGASGIADAGLLTFNTTTNSFYYYNGSTWNEMGSICLASSDTDGDTKIEVEKTVDDDIVRLSSAGTEVITIEDTAVTHNTGDLSIQNGTLVFGTEYSLPSNDGIGGYTIAIDNNQEAAWRNPAAALGLVTGIETSSFTNVMATHNIQNNVYYVRVMPWSDIRVSKMAFLLNNSASNIRPQLGIYDAALNRVALATSDTIAGPATTSIIEIPLEKSVVLIAGKIYWFAINDMISGEMSVWRYTAASGTQFSSFTQNSQTTLPILGVYSSSADKGFWIAAY